MGTEMTHFERCVMDAILTGENNVLKRLRQQLKGVAVRNRDYTGVGCFIEFEVERDLPPLSGRQSFTIDDVHAEINGLEHGVGFVLFVRDGYIDCLEGFTFDEPWPGDIASFRLWYTNNDKRNLTDVPDGECQSDASATVD